MRLAGCMFFALWMIIGMISGNRLLAQINNAVMKKTPSRPEPAALVYKTKKDYSNNVPVILSADKQHIVSYLDPKDVKAKMHSNKPTKLHAGYWLDERGISPNVAYLKMTFDEYAQLTKALSLNQMEKMIIDKDPIVEMCNCGSRYGFKDAKNNLNKIIDSGKLRTTCKVLK